MQTRSRRRRGDQQARILGAAFALFCERGFDEVTMADVAAAGGVSRATVFNQFGSKQALVDAITEQVLRYYQDLLDAALADERTPTPLLVRALFDHMALGIENTRRLQRGIFREIARLELGFDEGGPTQRAKEANGARLVKLLERGQERGELASAHRPEALGSAFTVLANGTITQWLFEEPSESLRERMRAAAEIFLAGVAPRAAATRDHPLPELIPARPWSFES
jgi:TetR/AcrR family acrAB operon transcriptional repressor